MIDEYWGLVSYQSESTPTISVLPSAFAAAAAPIPTGPATGMMMSAPCAMNCCACCSPSDWVIEGICEGSRLGVLVPAKHLHGGSLRLVVGFHTVRKSVHKHSHGRNLRTTEVATLPVFDIAAEV